MTTSLANPLNINGSLWVGGCPPELHRERTQHPQPMAEGEVTKVKYKLPPVSQNLGRPPMKKNYMMCVCAGVCAEFKHFNI